MQIFLSSAEIYTVSLNYHKQVTWEGGVESAATYVVLRLISANGAEGVAEIAARPSWNGCDPETLVLALRRLALPLLRNRDVADTALLSEKLGRLVENTAAKALVENAIADLIDGMNPAKRYAAAPVSYTVTRGTPDTMAREAAQHVEKFGFNTLKLKGGQGFETDCAMVKAVRKILGEKIALYVDVNGAHPYDEAITYLKAMHDLGVMAVEDPYNLKPNAALNTVQQQSPIPIITDFSVDGVSSTANFFEHGVRGISLKPIRFGMRKTLAMAEMASAHKAMRVVGLFGESQAGALHLIRMHNALTPTPELPVEASFYLTLKDHYLKAPITIANGMVTAPETKNLAQLIDWPRFASLGGVNRATINLAGAA